ncbi:MAG: glycosyltransferase family 2 protein [Muribaculaceae bacterium]|nr:glycosyltransferase family 2 protein [Muribaculaceae bacterium]
MKINCIVPVYNTSRYLRKCLNSILHQTHKDFKIYIVNDCSTDKSKTICEKYAARYPDKITFINKDKNEGVDKARFDALHNILSDNKIAGGG